MNSTEEEDPGDSAEHATAVDDSGLGACHEHNNLYKSVELRTGYVHEVVICNTDPKSVLTWDFDVGRSDLHFTVYRVTKTLPQQKGTFPTFFREFTVLLILLL